MNQKWGRVWLSGLLALGMSAPAMAADHSTADAALGGGLGGAAGAAIGNEIGGRNGAILGGAVGAAGGTAITTRHDQRDDYSDHHEYDHRRYRERDDDYRHEHGGFCPPGQAKKGRC